jgi:FdhE protein
LTQQPAVTHEPWTERRRRTADLEQRYPFVTELLSLYTALLDVQEEAYRLAISDPPDLDHLPDYVADKVGTRVAEVSRAAGPARLRTSMEAWSRVDAEVVRRWLRTEAQPPVDRYVARAALSPVLEAVPALVVACRGPRDERHCPSCGGPPQLSYFGLAGDDLAGGPRYLLCARCHNSWSYARMTCAGCGEDSSQRLPIFSEEGTASGERGSVVRGLPGGDREPAADLRPRFPHMRIEACDRCKRYLVSIDLERDARAVPVVDEMAALPLDLYAVEQGFAKITPNLMGF